MNSWQSKKNFSSKNKGYLSGLNTENLFVIISGEGIDKDKGDKFLNNIKEAFDYNKVDNISSFEQIVSTVIKDNNLPAIFSMAIGFYCNQILYLKTIGEGQIYIKRQNNTQLIISGDRAASGYPETNDSYIYTTSQSVLHIGINDIDSEVDSILPSDFIVIVAKMIELDSFEDKVVVDQAKTTIDKPNNFISSFKEKYSAFNHQKRITFMVVFLLLIIFIWSVILGYSRRHQAGLTKQIKLSNDLISQKLDSSQEVAYLNISRAELLISESWSEVEKLKKLGVKDSDLKDLTEKIAIAEKKIFKKEDKNHTEFFDLSLDNDKASGDKLYLDEDNLLIIDRKNSTLFTLSMTKKSLSKISDGRITKATAIGLFNDSQYFYIPQDGVYTIKDDKSVKVLPFDKDWGEVIDISLYNGNLYLLDSKNDEIWKYIKGETEFGTKSSYFASGQSIDLSSIRSLAIDASLYLAGNDVVVKYTSGLRDGFKMNLPNQKININKIITNKDLTSVYLWDKSASTVYTVSKTGEYIEQINSSILGKGSDVVVYEERIYVLSGSRVFEID